ncbi:related to oxidase [Ramularia collo-cygni]|uniref:Related to oxidase n=1 Tax=Ramularia collo-cygni TaxID=112498 RepID=A0A2D3VCY8_9PEZI|nr:related to oxidase [Ramularia collo-cygni]CZT19509.1 related to oxidase [Ramularia collo-cygni]
MYAFLAAPLVLLRLLGSLNIASASYHHESPHHHGATHALRATGPIEVTGDHEFRPPTKGQQRGPCPGLNALANHNYISRDGIASLLEITNAVTKVYNMELALGTIIAAMGVLWTGNLVTFSIGGADPRVPGLLGLLGHPQGLDLAHNFIESDASATRDDLFVTGDASTMNLARFEEMYNTVPENTGQTFTSDVISDWAAKRFNDSVAENPRFFYGPYTGLIARNAGILFLTRLMANHADGSIDGVLTHETLKSFFAVSGTPGNFTYKRGHERIPDNFYRRPVPYGLVGLNLDLVHWITRNPVLGSIGGNVGTVNSFAGVDLSDPVSGLTNIPKLLESNNLICFALEFVKLAAPSYTNNIFTTLAAPLGSLLDVINAPLLSLSCPEFGSLTQGGEPLWESLQKQFPGAEKSGM